MEIGMLKQQDSRRGEIETRFKIARGLSRCSNTIIRCFGQENLVLVGGAPLFEEASRSREEFGDPPFFETSL
jgi:hypothetical protein